MARILVVDDEMDILRMLGALFRSQGHDVVAIDDGNKAIDLLQSKEHFDLMISDVRMIPINGIWLLSFVREQLPNLPVIMITAYYSEEVAAQAIKMGAVDYLAKPFNTQQLLDLVNKVLKERGTSPASQADTKPSPSS